MTTFTIEFDQSTSDALQKAADARRTNVEALIADATAVYLAEEEGMDGAPPFTAEQIKEIELGIADIEAGRTVPHGQVFADLRAKHGW
jgi:predicted transcriptional regulator